MSEFEHKPVNNKSKAGRKLVFGKGINDAPYRVSYVDGSGRTIYCPAYAAWKSMLKRCYSSKCHAEQPTYIGCSVCEEWLTFSKFKAWFSANYVEGWHLDKDLRVKGNKIYSPTTCIYVPNCVNTLMSDSAAIRGLYPLGVYYHKKLSRFCAKVKIMGTKQHLGYHDNPDDAHKAYCIGKWVAIHNMQSIYPQFRQLLEQHKPPVTLEDAYHFRQENWYKKLMKFQ